MSLGTLCNNYVEKYDRNTSLLVLDEQYCILYAVPYPASRWQIIDVQFEVEQRQHGPRKRTFHTGTHEDVYIHSLILDFNRKMYSK